MRGEKIERIVNGAGRKISKRDGFHEGRARAKQYLSSTLNDLPDKSSCKSELITDAWSGEGSRPGASVYGLFLAYRYGHSVMPGGVPAGPQMKQIGTGEPIEGAAGIIQPPHFTCYGRA